MEPARIAKDRSRLLFFSSPHFSLFPYHTCRRVKKVFSATSNAWTKLFRTAKRPKRGLGQASRLRTGSSVTLADRVKRHACGWTLFCSSAAISTSNAWTKLFRTAKRSKRGLRSVATEKTADRALSAVWFIFKINCTWDSPQKLVDHPIKNSPCTWDCPPLLRMVPF